MGAPEASSELQLQIPDKPRFVGAARQAMVAIAHLHGLQDDLIQDLKLAVSEACTMAILATRQADAHGRISMEVWSNGNSLTVEVSDPGTTGSEGDLGMSPDRSGAPDEPASLPEDLSLPIIRGLVDQVEVVPNESGGTSLRMVLTWEPGPG